MPQETYSLASLDEDVDEDRTASTSYAPYENMLSATHLVVSLLVARQHQIVQDSTKNSSATDPAYCYGIQGGFSMQLRGGRQSTRDVDLVTSIKMKGVWDAITGESRIVIPDSRLVEGVLKIFVKTGAPHDACAEQHRIEVDIKQAGFRSSPRKLHGNVEVIGPFQLFGERVHFNVLSITAMMRIKIECCLTREEPRDFEDVRFMLGNHTATIARAVADGEVPEEELLEVLGHEKFGDARARSESKELLEACVGQFS